MQKFVGNLCYRGTKNRPVDHRVNITVIVPTTLTFCHSDFGSGAKAVTQCHHRPLNLARRSPLRENYIESWSPRARYCRHDNLGQSRMRRWRITSLSVHGHRSTDATPREGGRRGAANAPRRQARKAAARRRRKGACGETSPSVAVTSDPEIARPLTSRGHRRIRAAELAGAADGGELDREAVAVSVPG